MKKLAWFGGLYLGGLLALTVVAFALRWVLS